MRGQLFTLLFVKSIHLYINEILMAFLIISIGRNLWRIFILISNNILTVVKGLETIICVHISGETHVFEILRGLQQESAMRFSNFSCKSCEGLTTEINNNILTVFKLANPRK